MTRFTLKFDDSNELEAVIVKFRTLDANVTDMIACQKRKHYAGDEIYQTFSECESKQNCQFYTFRSFRGLEMFAPSNLHWLVYEFSIELVGTF